jgi:hypothetical protein
LHELTKQIRIAEFSSHSGAKQSAELYRRAPEIDNTNLECMQVISIIDDWAANGP